MDNVEAMYSIDDFHDWLLAQENDQMVDMYSTTDCVLGEYTKTKYGSPFCLWLDSGSVTDNTVTFRSGDIRQNLPEWCTLLLDVIYNRFDESGSEEDFQINSVDVKECFYEAFPQYQKVTA